MRIAWEKLSDWRWGAYWKSQRGAEEPGRWSRGGWQLTVQLGKRVLTVSRWKWPASAYEMLTRFQEELRDVAARLRNAPRGD